MTAQSHDHLLSDVHLEDAAMPLNGGRRLFLAGDICVAAELSPENDDPRFDAYRERCYDFFFRQCAKYDQVFYIPGNHENDGSVIGTAPAILRTYLSGTAIRVLDDEFVALDDGVILFGSTFWTDFAKSDWHAMHLATQRMPDHQCIAVQTSGGLRRFLPADAVDRHYRALEKLKIGLPNHERVVVMTHHAPSRKSVVPAFVGNLLNAAFHSELDQLILDHPQIRNWMHGHMHDGLSYTIGQCQVDCNPRGSRYSKLNGGFLGPRPIVFG